jgi:1-phosphatidylinositol-4-phosphate 5-kinase
MIKTQTQEEKDFLRLILPHYYTHLRENPHSFITHFYGMYRVKIPDLGKSIHFVIMKSVFNTDREIHKIWDLKGSTLGRRAKRGDGVSKDLDFVDEGRKLKVHPSTKTAIMKQLKKDSDFLAKMHIMDYSLLFGVHVCTQAEEESEKNMIRSKLMESSIRSNTPMRRLKKKEFDDNGGKNGVLKYIFESTKGLFGLVPEEERTQQSEDDSDSDRDDKVSNGSGSGSNELRTILSSLSSSVSTQAMINPYTKRDDLGIISGESKEIYFAGIIDILQSYNTRKWGETIMRKAAGGNEKAISCVNPEAYAERFVEFIEDIIEE